LPADKCTGLFLPCLAGGLARHFRVCKPTGRLYSKPIVGVVPTVEDAERSLPLVLMPDHGAHYPVYGPTSGIGDGFAGPVISIADDETSASALYTFRVASAMAVIDVQGHPEEVSQSLFSGVRDRGNVISTLVCQLLGFQVAPQQLNRIEGPGRRSALSQARCSVRGFRDEPEGAATMPLPMQLDVF
jgi:hypothetical protein